VVTVGDEWRFLDEYPGQSRVFPVMRDDSAQNVQDLIEQRLFRNSGEGPIEGPADLVLKDHHPQIFLARGLGKHGAAPNIRRVGNLPDRRRIDALSGEQLACGMLDARELVALVARTATDTNRGAGAALDCGYGHEFSGFCPVISEVVQK